jgi:gas vesicle structural protein
MSIERASGGSSLIDVLDRVLDKGIVIDAWVRLSLVGIDLVTVEARVVVASIATYLQFTEAVGISPVLTSAASAARLSTLPRPPMTRQMLLTGANTPDGHQPLTAERRPVRGTS